MYTAEQIAEWFLAHNREKVNNEGADLISNMKLQKLLYYAAGVYLALEGEALFSEPIVAWKHGPVVESVYHKYKGYKSNGIDYDKEFKSEDYDARTQAILTDVYDNFAQYSAWKLRQMTHEETPWKTTARNDVISNDKIKSYFEENYVE